jgi:recombination protein RecA
MAKQKEEKKLNLEETIKLLNKKYSKDFQESFSISTDSIALDVALGGNGIRSKRITELIAWEGGGKTTLCLHLTKNAQKDHPGKKVVYIDAEHALDETYARNIGVDWDNLILFQPSCGEEGFDYAKELIRTGEVSLVIFDSTSGLLPKKQMEDVAGTSNMGLHARLMGAEIPKIQNLISENNTACVSISQVREKIGVMFGSPETTQGGNALKFWASNRIELRKSLEKENDAVSGLKVKFKTLKCKTARPFQTGYFYINFGKGVDKIKEIIELSKDYDLIKVWGKKITYNEAEFVTDEFYQVLEDNPSLYEELKSKLVTIVSPVTEEVEQ